MDTTFDWYELDDDMGDAGLPGTGLTAGEKLDITTRLTANEAAVASIPAVTTDLDDFSAVAATSGQVPVHDGTDYVPTTLDLTHEVPFSLPVPVGYGPTITTGVKIDIKAMFAFSVAGWFIKNDPSGDIEYGVWKNGVRMEGANPPKVVGATSATGDVTGWTSTSVAIGDLFSVSVISVATVTSATLTLSLTRTI